MQYFKVPSQMDGKRVFRQLEDGSFERTFTPVRELVRDELYTERELCKLGLGYLKNKLECIEISRQKVCWFFLFSSVFFLFEWIFLIKIFVYDFL